MENETELKIENPTHNFREMELKLEIIQESRMKRKSAMRCSPRKKKMHFLKRLFCLK